MSAIQEETDKQNNGEEIKAIKTSGQQEREW
jgi:hypothetical protein